MSTQFPRKWSQQSSQNWLVLTVERHGNVRYFKWMGNTGPETKFIFKRFFEGCAQNMTQCNERHGWILKWISYQLLRLYSQIILLQFSWIQLFNRTSILMVMVGKFTQNRRYKCSQRVSGYKHKMQDGRFSLPQLLLFH